VFRCFLLINAQTTAKLSRSFYAFRCFLLINAQATAKLSRSCIKLSTDEFRAVDPWTTRRNTILESCSTYILQYLQSTASLTEESHFSIVYNIVEHVASYPVAQLNVAIPYIHAYIQVHSAQQSARLLYFQQSVDRLTLRVSS
jgi:hypothetical protein